jgi:hypothetical protein
MRPGRDGLAAAIRHERTGGQHFRAHARFALYRTSERSIRASVRPA